MAYIKNRDFYLELSKGNVPNHSDYSAYGINLDIDSATVPEDIWYNGGLFVAPTTYRVHNIVSSSVNDTAAGSGLRTLKVYGVVSTGLASETVIMNGTTNVATANSYTDIYLIEGLTWGGDTGNAGNITATAVTDATVTAYMPIGKNSTQKAIRLIPPGYTGYLFDWQGTMQQATASSFAEVYLMKKLGESWTPIRYHPLNNVSNNTEIDYFKTPYKLDAGVWIKAQCANVTNNNTLVQVSMNLILVKS